MNDIRFTTAVFALEEGKPLESMTTWKVWANTDAGVEFLMSRGIRYNAAKYGEIVGWDTADAIARDARAAGLTTLGCGLCCDSSY